MSSSKLCHQQHQLQFQVRHNQQGSKFFASFSTACNRILSGCINCGSPWFVLNLLLLHQQFNSTFHKVHLEASLDTKAILQSVIFLKTSGYNLWHVWRQEDSWSYHGSSPTFWNSRTNFPQKKGLNSEDNNLRFVYLLF